MGLACVDPSFPQCVRNTPVRSDGGSTHAPSSYGVTNRWSEKSTSSDFEVDVKLSSSGGVAYPFAARAATADGSRARAHARAYASQNVNTPNGRDGTSKSVAQCLGLGRLCRTLKQALAIGAKVVRLRRVGGAVRQRDRNS